MNIIQRSFMPTLAHCKLHRDESPVQSGLSYTPSDMKELTKKGYPVSPQSLNENLFIDSDFKPSNDFSVDLQYQRSANINDAWELSKDIKKKFRIARKEGAFDVSQSDINQ